MGDGSLTYDAWVDELPIDDPHRDFILAGVRTGFNILDIARANHYTGPIEVENYASATSPDNKLKTEKQIKVELENGRYVIVDRRPAIVSAIGAIPKSDGNIRIIHDASRPHGESLNDLWEKETFSYSGIQDATDMIKPGYFLAKVDLKSAYRSVRTHPTNYNFTGLKWTFEGDTTPVYMVDTRLPFGARRSPFIFNHLSQAVCRILHAKGMEGLVAYLDDFLIIQPSYH